MLFNIDIGSLIWSEFTYRQRGDERLGRIWHFRAPGARDLYQSQLCLKLIAYGTHLYAALRQLRAKEFVDILVGHLLL